MAITSLKNSFSQQQANSGLTESSAPQFPMIDPIQRRAAGSPDSFTIVDREQLANIINHIHFMDGHVLALLRNPRLGNSVLLRVNPKACRGEEITCDCSDTEAEDIAIKDYDFLHLIIDEGKSIIFVPATQIELEGCQLRLALPEESYAVNQRRTRRHVCRDVQVELRQGSLKFDGELKDFSPFGFRVKAGSNRFSQFNRPKMPGLFEVRLRNGDQIVFSGLCQCIRHWNRSQESEFVFVAMDKKEPCAGECQVRNPRQQLNPSPSLAFEHPLIGRPILLKVADISTSGFRVFEKEDEGVLMQDMIIPELRIDFSGMISLKCKAKVVYHRQEGGKGICCGIAILDMDNRDYNQLAHFLINTLDSHSKMNGDVDLDALWEFFFCTGFIYPKKYHLMEAHRDDFKRTYRKLYPGGPRIVRHFTYERNGHIYAHMSMVKAYENTWMLHHHAARNSGEYKRAGFTVLKQVLFYMNTSQKLPSTRADYVMCYFRPESKFPSRVFGGVAKELNDPKVCSVDLYSYMLYPKQSKAITLPKGWTIEEPNEEHLRDLYAFYDRRSGGLLFNSLPLDRGNSSDSAFEELYTLQGLRRQWKSYSLCYRGRLRAVFVVDRSNLGLNLSELLNNIKVLIADAENLPWDVLSCAINQLATVYESEKVPLLIYPSEYLDSENVLHDRKKYMHWLCDGYIFDRFTDILQRRFRLNLWN